MNLYILNTVCVVSLILQMLHPYIKSTTYSSVGFLGFICYPIFTFILVNSYLNSLEKEKKLFIKNILIYSVLLISINAIALLLLSDFSYLDLIDNNLFLSFSMFLLVDLMLTSIKTKRLTAKCNISMLLLFILALYICVNDNVLYFLLFFIFIRFKDNNLLKNISLIILGILYPLISGNIYSMGILLSIPFLYEFNLPKEYNHLKFNKFLFISISIFNISKILIKVGFN